MNTPSTGRSDFGVRGQILLLFGFSALLLIAAAGYGLWQFSASLRLFDENVAARQSRAIEVEAVEISFKKQVQEWKDTLLRGKSPEAFDKHWSAFQQRENDVHSAAERLSRSLPDLEARRLVTDFLAAHEKLGVAYRNGLEAFKASQFDSAVGDKAVAGIDRAPTELLGKAKDNILSAGETSAREARDGAQRTIWSAIAALLVVTIVSAVMFLFAVQARISKPLTVVVNALGQLANGDFAVVLPGLGRHDEIGEIARAVALFKVKAEQRAREDVEARVRQDQVVAGQRRADMDKLAASFESAVGQIVETVSAASTKMEASASSLTATAERTQELTTTVVAASDEASTNVASVASATEEMASSVNEISRQVQESARIASEAVQQAERTNQRVGQLSKAAARIGDVVELINSIAGQTNLLALNATIEAARAGEAGRGFAVVASEVKALAEQTAKATGEIGQQITGIQAATQESVGAIQEISGTIEKLSEISSTIATAVEQQGSATQEISRSVQQAAQGTQRVSSNIASVQRGAGETGLASSQVLSAAQSLSGDSDRLKLEVSKFLDRVRAA